MKNLVVILVVIGVLAGCGSSSQKVSIGTGTSQILDDLKKDGGGANDWLTMCIVDGEVRPVRGGWQDVQTWVRLASMSGLKEDDWMIVWRKRSDLNVFLVSVYRPAVADPTRLERVSTQKVFDLAEVAKNISVK